VVLISSGDRPPQLSMHGFDFRDGFAMSLSGLLQPSACLSKWKHPDRELANTEKSTFVEFRHEFRCQGAEVAMPIEATTRQAKV